MPRPLSALCPTSIVFRSAMRTIVIASNIETILRRCCSLIVNICFASRCAPPRSLFSAAIIRSVRLLPEGKPGSANLHIWQPQHWVEDPFCPQAAFLGGARLLALGFLHATRSFLFLIDQRVSRNCWIGWISDSYKGTKIPSAFKKYSVPISGMSQPRLMQYAVTVSCPSARVNVARS